MIRSTARLLVFLWLVCIATQPAFAKEAKIRIVFFTPKDVQPPANVEERMKEVVDYGQAYYSKWLNHWGYPTKTALPIDRNEAGIPKIYFLKGTETAASGKYDKIGYHGIVRNRVISEHNVPREGSTWWIFVYGTKLRASRGWGGFNDRNGLGIAQLVWHDFPAGKLTNETPLAGGIAEQINLKGYLHELGHTMNMAHFGPTDRHSKKHGMSLMGVNARTYHKSRNTREENVFITPATAAIIWKQPQITGVYNPQPKPPRIEVPHFKPEYDARRKRFVLSGKLVSNANAHSVVAIDVPDKGPSDYWKKSYASRLQKDDSFELIVEELAPSSGKLLVLFCFDDGYITGNGKGFGYKFAAEIPYQFTGRRHTIGK